MQLQIQLCGQYTLRVAGVALAPLPTERSRTLLAYLALHPAPQLRSHLIGVLWPDLAEKQARRRLTQEMWRINNELGKAGLPTVLTTQGDAITFTADVEIVCDAQKSLAYLADWQCEHQDTQSSLAALNALVCGELLPGCFDDWVLVMREKLFQMYGTALMRLLTACKQVGDWESATSVIDALRRHDPLSEVWIQEALHVALNSMRYDVGLQQYEQYVVALRKTLELAPSPELVRLAHEVAAQRAPAPPPTHFADPTYQPPLIGREAERSLLLYALQQAIEKRGQIHLIEGMAGVGKTRLLESIVADARWRNLAIGQGRGLEIQHHQAYQPLLQALRELLSPLRSQQVRILLDPLWLALAARLLPVLAEWLPDLPAPPPLATEPDRVRTLEALTRLLLALAKLTPIVLVLDDLQWVDNATLDLLIYLARRIGDSPLLILLSYRPIEVRDNEAVWLALHEIDRSGHAQRLELTGVSAESSAELVRILLRLDQPAPRFEHRLYAQTCGNPFFIIETLRTLHQEGSLVRTADGRWHTPWDAVTVDYNEAAIPTQVDDLIRRRLAQLAPDERQVLDVAVVLGAPFDLSLLTFLTPLSALQLLTATATLVQRHFLKETPTAFQIEHDQIRHTVYHQLEPSQRRSLHRRAGEALSQVHPDAHSLLAHHFEQAGVIGRAFEHHWKAGEAAQQTGAYRLARVHYEKIAAWLDMLPVTKTTRVRLLLQWERLLGFLGDRPKQMQVLTELTQTPGLDAREQSIVLMRRALAAGDAGRYDSALALIADSFVITQHLDDHAHTAETLIAWGQLLHRSGDATTAEAKLREAVTVAGQEPQLQAEAWSALADVLPERNAYPEAMQAAEAALTIFEQVGDAAGGARANVALAIVAMEQGNVRGAIERYRAAQTLAQQCGYRLLEARIAANLANALCTAGQIGEALRQYEHSLAIGRALDDARLESLITVNYASTYISFIGPDDHVVQQVQRALAWGESAGDNLCAGQAWNILSMDAAYRGDLPRARMWLDRSIAAFAQVEYGFVKVQALRAQAQLCQMENDLTTALGLIQQALATSQQIGATHLTTELHAIEGEILLALGRRTEAIAAIGIAAAQAPPDIFQAHLLHYRCFKVWQADGQLEAATRALRLAMQEFDAILDGLSPEQRRQSCTSIPAHRALLADAASQTA